MDIDRHVTMGLTWGVFVSRPGEGITLLFSDPLCRYPLVFDTRADAQKEADRLEPSYPDQDVSVRRVRPSDRFPLPPALVEGLLSSLRQAGFA
ncbi:MAG TPA: hypothetical protein VGI39_39690 [Polyangiaceae bacterium]|jgi:hypothetical protein